MACSITQFRAYQLTGAEQQPLAVPLALDYTKDVIPYGARVRLEVDIQSDLPTFPPLMMVLGSELGSFNLSPTETPGVFATELILPRDLFTFREMHGEMTSDRFPLPGFSTLMEQEILTVQCYLVERSSVADLDTWQVGNLYLRLAPPPLGGTPPRLRRVTSSLTDHRVLLGQPWRFAVEVEEPSQVQAVFCSVTRGDSGFWQRLQDDGLRGDQQAGDGIYSVLRVGGDIWDYPGCLLDHDVPCLMRAQALDIRGNWSEPLEFPYTLCYTQLPFWQQEADPAGPDILEADFSWQAGVLNYAACYTRCSDPTAWVCGRTVGSAPMTFPCFDDGVRPDQQAGDGIASAFVLYRNPERRVEVVLYGVSQDDPPHLGRQLALSIPPVVMS